MLQVKEENHFIFWRGEAKRVCSGKHWGGASPGLYLCPKLGRDRRVPSNCDFHREPSSCCTENKLRPAEAAWISPSPGQGPCCSFPAHREGVQPCLGRTRPGLFPSKPRILYVLCAPLCMSLFAPVCVSPRHALFQKSTNNIKSENKSKLSEIEDLLRYYAHNPYKD